MAVYDFLVFIFKATLKQHVVVQCEGILNIFLSIWPDIYYLFVVWTSSMECVVDKRRYIIVAEFILEMFITNIISEIYEIGFLLCL